jgi:hypothetical protein
MPAVKPWNVLQGTFVCRCTISCCTSGFQTAAPSGHGEAARAQARLWPGTPLRALDLAAGQSSCTSGHPRRVRAPRQSMPLSSPSPCEVTSMCEPGFAPCVCVCFHVVTRGAAPRRTGSAVPRLRLPGGCTVRPCTRTRACVRAPASAPQRRAAAGPYAAPCAPTPGRHVAPRSGREGQIKDHACAPPPRDALGVLSNTWCAAAGGRV